MVVWTTQQQAVVAILPKVSSFMSFLGSSWIAIEIVTDNNGTSINDWGEPIHHWRSNHNTNNTNSNGGGGGTFRGVGGGRRFGQKRKLCHPYHRLILAMCIYDICESVWNFMSTWPIPPSDEYERIWSSGTQGTCTAQGFFLQVAVAIPIYNASLAVYYMLVINYRFREETMTNRVEPLMHLIAFVVGFGTSLTMVFMGYMNDANLWCWIAPYPQGCLDSVRHGFPPENPNPCTRGDHAWIFRWSFYFGPLWLCIITAACATIMVYIHVYRVERQSLQYRIPASSTMHNGDKEKKKKVSKPIGRICRDLSSITQRLTSSNELQATAQQASTELDEKQLEEDYEENHCGTSTSNRNENVDSAKHVSNVHPNVARDSDTTTGISSTKSVILDGGNDHNDDGDDEFVRARIITATRRILNVPAYSGRSITMNSENGTSTYDDDPSESNGNGNGNGTNEGDSCTPCEYETLKPSQQQGGHHLQKQQQQQQQVFIRKPSDFSTTSTAGFSCLTLRYFSDFLAGRLWNQSVRYNPRTAQVAHQAFWYLMAFMLAHVWSTTNRIYQQLHGGNSIFALTVVHSFFDPFQGALNFFVYQRPRYMIARKKHPELGRIGAWWHVCQFSCTRDRMRRRREELQNAVRYNSRTTSSDAPESIVVYKPTTSRTFPPSDHSFRNQTCSKLTSVANVCGSTNDTKDDITNGGDISNRRKSRWSSINIPKVIDESIEEEADGSLESSVSDENEDNDDDLSILDIQHLSNAVIMFENANTNSTTRGNDSDNDDEYVRLPVRASWFSRPQRLSSVPIEQVDESLELFFGCVPPEREVIPAKNNNETTRASIKMQSSRTLSLTETRYASTKTI